MQDADGEEEMMSSKIRDAIECVKRLFGKEDNCCYTYVSCYPDELEKLETSEDVVRDLARRLAPKSDASTGISPDRIVLEFRRNDWTAYIQGTTIIIEGCQSMDEAARMLWMECRSIWEAKP